MIKLTKGTFINYTLTVEKFLKENGFTIESYKEKNTNGVFTLTTGEEISTNGYVFKA